ncbi:MAG: hypothetical protein MUP80_09105 [Acidobacteriia bacterium]|nr:hypothetical protein [Terriglobia bacterium]
MPKIIKHRRSKNWLRRLLRREPVPCATGEETAVAKTPNEDIARLLLRAGVIRAPTPEETAAAEVVAGNLTRQLREDQKNPALTAEQRRTNAAIQAQLRQAEVYRNRRLTFEGAACLAARLEAFLDREDRKDAEADSEIRKQTFSDN